MNDTALEQVAEGIADAKGVEPQELDLQLQHHVSTAAIRHLVNHDSESWKLQFETPDHVVEITEKNALYVDGEQIRTIS